MPSVFSQMNQPKMSIDQYISKIKSTSTLEFRKMSENYILQIINQLKNKNSPGYDNISNKVLKQIKHIISKPLSLINNQSFKIGIIS